MKQPSLGRNVSVSEGLYVMVENVGQRSCPPWAMLTAAVRWNVCTIRREKDLLHRGQQSSIFRQLCQLQEETDNGIKDRELLARSKEQ